MRRLGALLGAVVMVAAAFAVRGAVTDDAEVLTGGTVTEPDRLVCPVEFEDLCRSATGEVTAEQAGATADRLIEATSVAELGAGAWITPAAWARLVVAERDRLDREPLFEIVDGPIASSPVVLAVWTEHATELSTLCGQEAVDWSCIAAQAGQRVLGSQVRPGSPPVDSGTGLVVAAAQVGALLGTADYAANDFTGELLQLADRLANKQVRDPLAAMRTKGPGEFTAVGVVGADARTVSTTFGTIVVLDDREPLVRADVVALVPAGSDLADARQDTLRDAFTAGGWGQPAGGPDGLPTGGVLAAVRTLWNESR